MRGMLLSLYRRHNRKCTAHHPEDSQSFEQDERKKTFKRCRCYISASGTLDKIFKRRNTGECEWIPAKIIAAGWEAKGTWHGETVLSLQSLPAPSSGRMPIPEATARFLEDISAAAETSTEKYALLLKRLNAYSLHVGYVMIDQWRPDDVRKLRDTWPQSPQTAEKTMGLLKYFFEFCLENEWTTRNPARRIRKSRSRDAADRRNDQKSPFTDEELERMIAACSQYGGRGYAWTGDDLVDFIYLSCYTGLRISDVCLFHIDRMLPDGQVHIRTTKTGSRVFTWVPEWLQERIRARALKHGAFIFGKHKTTDLDTITDLWRTKLRAVWDTCGPWAEKPTPHRFRHTFARILLQRPGVTVRDVAELLGNTEEQVRKRYSAWVPDRQERLTKILKDAFAEKPRPGVIPIDRAK
jgi:integrase